MAKINKTRKKLVADLRSVANVIENREGRLVFNDVLDIAGIFGASIEEDNSGQMVIYTGLRDTKVGVRSV